MRFRSAIVITAATALLSLALSGCGQKGPLVPPKALAALNANVSSIVPLI